MVILLFLLIQFFIIVLVIEKYGISWKIVELLPHIITEDKVITIPMVLKLLI